MGGTRCPPPRGQHRRSPLSLVSLSHSPFFHANLNLGFNSPPSLIVSVSQRSLHINTALVTASGLSVLEALFWIVFGINLRVCPAACVDFFQSPVEAPSIFLSGCIDLSTQTPALGFNSAFLLHHFRLSGRSGYYFGLSVVGVLLDLRSV